MLSDVGCVFTSGQSHSSIIDRNGMAVAITSSVNQVFGSRVIDPVSGILLNDEVCSVGKKGGSFSHIGPDGRFLHSWCTKRVRFISITV